MATSEEPCENRGLTESQRFRFDHHGYVLLRGVLHSDHVDRLRAALKRLQSEPDLACHRVYVNRDDPHFWHVGNLPAYDCALLEYAVHPKLLACVREVVGGDVRLEESEAIVNRRNPAIPDEAWNGRSCLPIGFHTGARPDWGTWIEQDRFHCLFVKTLAFLTDVGPYDGGTAVVPGSHRSSWEQAQILDAVREDPTLAVQIEAKAGDVLLFPESLVHSSTEIRSDRERMIVVSGYTPPFLREWPGNEIASEFLNTLPPEIRPVLSGEQSWHWRRTVKRRGGTS